MRLVPVDLIRGHRSDIQAIDIWGGNKTINQIRIGSDCCNHKTRPQGFRYLFLGYFDDAGKGEHKLLIRHYVLGAFAEDESRQQIRTSIAGSKSSAVTIRRRDFSRSGRAKPLINQLRNSLRDVCIDEGCQLCLRIIGRAWKNSRQAFG